MTLEKKERSERLIRSDFSRMKVFPLFADTFRSGEVYEINPRLKSFKPLNPESTTNKEAALTKTPKAARKDIKLIALLELLETR